MKNAIDPKKILIIRPDMIGDCMLITPAISLLKERFPQAEIYVLCKTYTKDIFKNNKNITGIIEDWFAQGKASSLAAFKKYAKLIKEHNFDCSIHFYNELPYALLSLLAGIKIRIGDSAKPLIKPFYTLTNNCKWNNLALHEVEHNILLLKPLGIELSKETPPMKLTPSLQTTEKIKQQYKIDQGRLNIILHIGTGKGNRAFLPESYARVIDCLIEKYQANVFLTGSEKEIPLAGSVMHSCKKQLVNTAGKTSLDELISLISLCKLFIGVDTGPMHIAAALKMPTLAISPTKFTKPTEWGPWQTQHIVVRNKINCSLVCRPAKCKENICLEQISPEQIIQAAEILINGKGIKTLEGSKKDWLKKSLNILTNNSSIQQTLCSAGYNAIKSKFVTKNLLVKEDINIIHWSGGQLPVSLFLAKFMATPYLSISPIIVSTSVARDIKVEELIKLYLKKLEK